MTKDSTIDALDNELISMQQDVILKLEEYLQISINVLEKYNHMNINEEYVRKSWEEDYLKPALKKIGENK